MNQIQALKEKPFDQKGRGKGKGERGKGGRSIPATRSQAPGFIHGESEKICFEIALGGEKQKVFFSSPRIYPWGSPFPFPPFPFPCAEGALTPMNGKNCTTAISNSISVIAWMQSNYSSKVTAAPKCVSKWDVVTIRARSWLKKYLNGGLNELVCLITHQKPSRLSSEQQQQLKVIVLEHRPTDYGIDRQMWTGAILSEVIAQRNGSAIERFSDL